MKISLVMLELLDQGGAQTQDADLVVGFVAVEVPAAVNVTFRAVPHFF
jgi:hypothetical protein